MNVLDQNLHYGFQTFQYLNVQTLPKLTWKYKVTYTREMQKEDAYFSFL